MEAVMSGILAKGTRAPGFALHVTRVRGRNGGIAWDPAREPRADRPHCHKKFSNYNTAPFTPFVDVRPVRHSWRHVRLVLTAGASSRIAPGYSQGRRSPITEGPDYDGGSLAG